MWLVQRCKPKGTYKQGQKVSEYMSLDYMGSAEFEFGAIPHSIRRLAEKSNLIIKPLKVTNKKGHDFTVHVLADAVDQEAAQDNIVGYLEDPRGPKGTGRGQLKEWISFRDIITESEHGLSEKESFWWCVDERSSNFGQKDDSLNFCWTLDPEQARCFKLALGVSLTYMNEKRAEEAKTN